MDKKELKMYKKSQKAEQKREKKQVKAMNKIMKIALKNNLIAYNVSDSNFDMFDELRKLDKQMDEFMSSMFVG